MAPPPKKRKVVAGGRVARVEEITFNPDAREEYLSGFHKRKVERAKHAQDLAAKKAKEEKRDHRRKIREDRQKELQQAIEQHQEQMRIDNGGELDLGGSDSSENDDEWGGIEEPPPIDYEAEYIDEDKYTTVTVEDMDPSKAGLQKQAELDNENSGDEKSKKEEEEDNKDKETTSKDSANSKKRIWAKDNPNKEKKAKKKKRNFRYETPTERKATRLKQRQKNSKHAKQRRDGE